MATKDNRNQARALIEQLESRLHTGPPIADAELLTVSDFLRRKEFSEASDYHTRLRRLRDQVTVRSKQWVPRHGKRNYGGQAAGAWMQVQSAYDHLILSVCYAGEFNTRRGRIKISHRFNREGRIDFVELKFVSALLPCLNGAFRKLLMVKNYQTIKKDWRVAEAFVLPVLPKELIFLYENVFRAPRHELLAWLINVGHGITGDLRQSLRLGARPEAEPAADPSSQLPLGALVEDQVALPILTQAADLRSTVQCLAPDQALVRY